MALNRLTDEEIKEERTRRLYSEHTWEHLWFATRGPYDTITTSDFFAYIKCRYCGHKTSALNKKVVVMHVGQVFGVGCHVCKSHIARIFLTEYALYTTSIEPAYESIKLEAVDFYDDRYNKVPKVRRG